MRLCVYDIETYGGLFLYIEYDLETKTWFIFQISNYKNDLYALVRHLLRKEGYSISFNGVTFDNQVLQYIIENHDRWNDLSSREIIRLIKKFSNRVIEDTNYGLFPPYREEQFDIAQMDLFKIHHFDNENRKTSLKWLQFSMDFYNVEESPIEFTREEFTLEEIQECIDYCKNDIESTYEFYKYTIGEVEHEEYKGRNKIADRLDIIQELKLPAKALNWSDVKIGDEINKKVYLEITGLSAKDLYIKKKNRKSTAGFTYGMCIPKYVKFKTKPFQDFHERMRSVRVNLKKKEEYPFVHNGTQYMIAKGGIHSNEKARMIIPGANEILRDADVGSQYPHSIIKRELFPSHLGKPWLVGYTGTRDRRLSYKDRIKLEGKKFKGLAEMYKLALNGGGFGKTNEQSNWQYDPFVHYSCTIGNQFEILMLVEELEMNGIHVVSANTDGILCLFDISKDELYKSICKGWEKVVGNDVHGKLEFTDYTKLVQTSVNDYLAIKKDDGSIKLKGDFVVDPELSKNKSRRIIPIALREYFTKGISVEETITKHDRIFDFCIGVKASRDYHYETQDKGETEIYHRMVRYFVSLDGKKLLKIKNPESESDGNPVTNCEAGGWKCTIANKIDKQRDIKSYNIDYSYYINKVTERIRSIEAGRTRKGKKINTDKNQLNLF